MYCAFVQFAGGCFGGAAIWQYENMRAHAIEMLNKRMIKIQEKKVCFYFEVLRGKTLCNRNCLIIRHSI